MMPFIGGHHSISVLGVRYRSCRDMGPKIASHFTAIDTQTGGHGPIDLLPGAADKASVRGSSTLRRRA